MKKLLPLTLASIAFVAAGGILAASHHRPPQKLECFEYPASPYQLDHGIEDPAHDTWSSTPGMIRKCTTPYGD